MVAKAGQDWNPGTYGRFRDLRLRPALDLLHALPPLPEGPVVDLGCGGGATTLTIAEAVGPEGAAVGLDVAPMLVERASQRAVAAGSAARFVCADAATATLDEPPFDRLFSRFGSMFFETPVPAFTNLKAMLKRGARIDLAVWANPRDNLWMMEMMGVVRQHIEIPPAIPRAPGPFAFEDLTYLEDVLTAAGFADMTVAVYEGLQPVGGPDASPEDATDFVLASMAAGRVLEEHGPAVRDAARADLLALFNRHYREGEGVMLRAKAWLVSARKH
jgi:SAM-dependent methyltransferase